MKRKQIIIQEKTSLKPISEQNKNLIPQIYLIIEGYSDHSIDGLRAKERKNLGENCVFVQTDLQNLTDVSRKILNSNKDHEQYMLISDIVYSLVEFGMSDKSGENEWERLKHSFASDK